MSLILASERILIKGSRRRKIKCNGARPFCQNCLRLKDECKWSSENDPDGVVLRDEDRESLVTENQHRVLIGLFFSVPHLSVMRQSIHRPSFESTDLHDHPPFLLAAIYCLSALYISDVHSREVFNGESALNLSHRLAMSAQKHSRDTSDQPTGMLLRVCRSLLMLTVHECTLRKQISSSDSENCSAGLVIKRGCILGLASE